MRGSLLVNGEFAFVPLLAIVPIIVWHGIRSAAEARVILLRVVVAFSVAAIVAVTLFPLPLPPYDTVTGIEFDYRGWPYPWLSPIPLATIRPGLGLGLEHPAARYLLGNVLALVPLGILVSLVRPARLRCVAFWAWQASHRSASN